MQSGVEFIFWGVMIKRKFLEVRGTFGRRLDDA